jgi:hypothetical protein
MPFKNKIKNRKYQREWQWKRIRGLLTKSPIKRKKMSKNELRERQRLTNKRCRKKKREYIFGIIGSHCIICEKKANTVHRIDNARHKAFEEMSMLEVIEELSKNHDKYAPTCHNCHVNIHWCIRYLGITWEEVMDLVQRKHGTRNLYGIQYKMITAPVGGQIP